jgi:hypothetical protein
VVAFVKGMWFQPMGDDWLMLLNEWQVVGFVEGTCFQPMGDD